MFVQVNLMNPRVNAPLLVPGDALIVQSTGPQMAVLGNARRVEEQQGQPDEHKQNKDRQAAPKKQKPVFEGTVHLQSVTVGRDYGAALEVLAGINEGDLVIVNPNDAVREGVKARATQSAETLDEQNASPQGAKQNVNSERVQPEKNAEPEPKQPSRPKKSRGPGY
jgi:hypothetical protein